MLPESKFPVTGGIMQSEEVVARAQSSLLDATASECGGAFSHQSSVQSPQQQQQQHPLQPYPLRLISMAVKQEPQEEEERARQANTLSPQMQETEDGHCLPEGNADQRRPSVQVGCAESHEAPAVQVPQNQAKKQPSRGRRKSRWKLKFHHQALPPEYLDHYEAALAQEASLTSSSPAGLSGEPRLSSPPGGLASPLQPGFVPTPLNDVQGWLQRFAMMQSEIYAPQPASHCPLGGAQRRSVITSTQSSQQPGYPVYGPAETPLPALAAQPTSGQVSSRPPMKYSDLPYMGEITLDNSKPRRGRKPKKADICHLIYKNYGTILPGTPGLEDKSKLTTSSSSSSSTTTSPQDKLELREAQLPIAFQRTDIQNRISSLLEKRLTQERRALDALPAESAREQEKPLNLCIRDLNHLKIRPSDKPNNVFRPYQSKSDGSSDPEDVEYIGGSSFPETDSPTDYQADLKSADLDGRLHAARSSLANNGNDASEHASQQIASNGNDHEADGSYLNNHAAADPAGLQQKPGLVYWPNAGVLLHPVGLQSQFLYYQKLAQEKGLPSGEQASKDQRIVPKSIYSMLENTSAPLGLPSPAESPASVTDPIVGPRASPSRTKRATVAAGVGGSANQQQPAKRKRSAIFIPPMPTENNSNPATEVSICKFKFTGGAKPSLQEKKSLSVDSGGNFRYYSGTGDKSMRGYEFFPREALQQQQQQSSSPVTSPVATSQQQPNFLAGGPVDRLATPGGQSSPARRQGSPGNEDARARKRKSRKSIQREKLEQTFKEKGFLIQTQQLESAEGATYCKFRQLRKFTRYLFRSWKDYLPGNVRELNAPETGEPSGPPGLKPEIEPESESALSPPASELELRPALIIEDSSPSSLSLN